MDFNKEINKYFVYLPVALIKGIDINKYLPELLKTQYLSFEKINEIQLLKLREMFIYAKKNVPHYEDILNEVVVPEINSLSDLEKIPFMTKAVLKEDANSVRSKNKYHRLTKKTTAGSTGEPFTLWKSTEAMAQELAATWRGYSWAGIDIGDRQARFWGVPINKSDYWKSKLIDFVANRKRCSAFSFDDEKLAEYTRKLLAFKPKYFYGYVSMLTEYARYFTKIGKEPPFELSGIITTSEILSMQDRNLLETTFNTKVYNEYGSAEVGTVAHECRYGKMHISSENMIVEIIDGDRVCEAGEVGEIVISELNNKAMPLLRYKTGDLGSMSVLRCKCGCSLPILEKIEGRMWDMIHHKDGRKFHPAFFLYIFEDAKDRNLGIRHYKIIQEDYQKFKILIVPGPNYSKKTEAFIGSIIQREFDKNTELEFKIVESIRREPSGKLRQLVGLQAKSV